MKLFFQNNVAYTRGALLALFAGLFILAACGGVNVAPTFVINNPPADSLCVTNPYGPTCTKQKEAAIELCREAIAGGNDCADNTPESVVSCLTDPFSTACTTAHATENPFEGTEITIAKEQEKRQDTCLRSDTTAVCETAVSSLCSSNPFTQTTGDTPTNLCVDITGTAYADARAEACLASPDGTPVNSSCATNTLAENTCETAPFGRTGCDNLDEIDGYRTTFCTVTDVFNPSCGDTDEYGATNAARDGFCRDTAAEGNSDCASRLTGICTMNGGTSPFSRLCGTNVASQRIFCTTNRAHVGTTGNCPDTITTFCTDSANDIFDTLCNDDAGTYDVARGRQCVADGTTGGVCGDEDSGYIQDYCDTAAGLTNVTHCPDTYENANPAVAEVNVTALAGKALNSEGTALLTGADGTTDTAIISSGNAHADNDDPANFIAGGTAVLDLGTSVTTTNASTLTLGMLDNDSDANGGFAIAVGEFDSDNHRFYVGLLSNTALGAPLNDAEQGGIWSAKIHILTSITNNAFLEADFKLNVDFATKSLKIVNAAGADANINFTIGNARLAFNIDGKFTANGVIYGTVDFTGADNNGTLTGLIGQNGAVGIFKRNSDSSPYVGGFVAAKTDCTATGTPFHADCTTTKDYDLQARLCNNHRTTSVANFNTNCRDNGEVTSRVCEFKGTHANPFNKDICTGAGYDNERARFCFRRNTIFRHFGITRLAGFSVARDCAGDSVVQDQVCSPHGAYARPFDLQVCPDSDGESVAVRAGLCSNNDERPVTDFNTRCLKTVIQNLVCAPSGKNANPFDKVICPDTSNQYNEVRAQACRDRTLPDGVNLLIDCARDSAITDLICADSGANANPFDSEICLGDQATAQTNFLDNCKGNTAGGANCDRYTDCVANPYMDGCDATYYVAERKDYTERLLTYCSSDRAGETAPVGAPDCATPTIQAVVCASSGTYANPLDAEVCPESDVADIDMIQNEFTTTCYHARADLSERPECENIATCFMLGKLANNTETSTDGRFACNIGGLFDVKNLVICSSYVYGQPLPQDCNQATIDKACNANPFSTALDGIDCISDRTRDTARNELCFGAASVQYDCTETRTRACMMDATSKYCPEDMANSPCMSDPFGDTCFDNDTYRPDRLLACNGISAQITPNTVWTNEDNTLQNCLYVIDEECSYDETEQFTNDFCKIGTLYDAERGRLCLYGYTPANAGDTIVIPTECASNTSYEVAYCSELALEGNMECDGRKADICTTNNGTAPFAPLCGENLAVQMKFCTEGVTTIFDTRCASADGLTQTVAGTNNARREACGGNEGESNRATDAQCADTVLRVCGSERGQLDTPFHSACLRKKDGAYVYEVYVVARGEACFDQGFNPSIGTCGDEDSGTYIKDYCATDAGNTNVTYCPKKYAGANPVNTGDTANVATLTAKALNAEGTALLPTFIADGAANTATDDPANFIDGGATGLNLGDAVTANADIPAERNLALSDDATSGFAVASAGSGFSKKYYVGILSNTDLGVLLTVQPSVDWTGKLSITGTSIDGDDVGGVYEDITLNVNLEDKELSLKDGSLDISNNFSELLTLDIEGKFTANGVIYGRVVIEDADGYTDFNNGTLTGLIGVEGAVGIFKSNPRTDTTYVGGFVVAPSIDCSEDGTPFHVDCPNNPAEQKKLANACFAGGVKHGTPQCNQFINGVDGLKIADCNANPYRTTDGCFDNVAFVDARTNHRAFCVSAATVFDIKCDILADTEAAHIIIIHLVRGRACVRDVTPPRGVCGSEETAGYIQDYCGTAEGTASTEVCKMAYSLANPTLALVDVSWLGSRLRKSATDTATVIAAGGAITANDADANFIVGGAGALDTGLTQTNDDTFRLNELDNRADANSGFAVAIATQKYYVGLLSGTALGRVLPTTTTEAFLDWPAQLRILRGTTFETAQDFTLRIELNAKTISVKSGTLDASVFAINNGGFTNYGLLYGTVTVANANAGTLTGLIGTSGAVGIFKSNVGSASDYVGGFVSHTDVDCSREGTPFDIICADNAAEREALAISCRNGELGINRGTPVCNQFINGVDGLSIAECIWNPYRTTNSCNTNPAFASERWNILHFCANLFTTFAAQCDILPDTQVDHAANTNIARGKACAVGYFPAQFGTTTMRVCGSETTAGSYLAEYCGTETGQGDVGNCKIAYSEANPTLARVDVSWLGSRLLKSATTTATVIAEGAGDTANDDDANFIVGGAGALVTGISTQANDDLLTLNGVGISEDTNSGFAVAIAEQKYYVGLLSGTNLGSVLPTATTETFLDWPAQLRILRDTTFETALDFTLRIELSAKTISVKSGTLDASVFAINDGKYATYGLLYGTVTVAGTNAGTLTGLIGGKGAVGIFKSDVASASDYVGGFVAASAEVNCTADGTPFDVGCTNNAAARAALATSCRSGQGGSRHGTVACSQFINGVDGLTIAECIHRPHRTTSGCNTNPAFAGERWNLLHFCVLNRTAPFTYQCDVLPDIQADYADNIRFTRGQICIERGEGFTPPRGVCGSETLAGSHLEGYCSSVMGQKDKTNCAIAYVSYVEAYCASDDIGVATNITLCPNGYARLNGDAGEVSVPAIGTGENQLLNSDGSGALTVIPAVPPQGTSFYATNFIGIAAGSITPLTLNSTHKGLRLADEEDGFAFGISGTKKLYIGLLPGTSLGAPLRNATAQTATWDADLSVLFYNGSADAIENKTFKLQVNFGGDTDNTLAIMGDAPSITGPGVFSLDGKFTRNGVIYGTVGFTNASYGAGTLTGLIGVDGVVGIFKSDDPNLAFAASRYVGGFIAAPTPADVTAIDFKAKARQNNGMDTLTVLGSGVPDTNIGSVNFIEGKVGESSLGIENVDETSLLLSGNKGGVAFTFGNASGVANYHVGILADTNVGPALNNDVTGDWVGKIQAIVNGSDTTEQAITFNVNFGANSFAIKDGTAPTFANIGAMTMDGRFTDTGVIYGSVYFGGANTNTGMLTGLIGQNALVGAFAGNGGLANPYVGGFIANKPTQ